MFVYPIKTSVMATLTLTMARIFPSLENDLTLVFLSEALPVKILLSIIIILYGIGNGDKKAAHALCILRKMSFSSGTSIGVWSWINLGGINLLFASISDFNACIAGSYGNY
jgi:hypothetical protein